MRLVLEMVDKVATMALRDILPGTEGETRLSYPMRTMTIAAMLVSDSAIDAISHAQVSLSLSRVRLMDGPLDTELGCTLRDATAGDGFSCG